MFCSSFLYGLGAGWNGPGFNLLTSSNSTFHLSLNDVTWITSLPTAFSTFLTIIFFIFMNNYSRKKLIIYNIFLYFVSWILCLISNKSAILLISKIICDCGNAIYDIIACIYIGEISSPHNRGIFGALLIIFFSFGNEIEELLGIFNNYSLLSAFPLIVSIIGLCSLFFMVESPYYLSLKNKTEETMTVLSFLYSEKEAENRFREILEYCEENNENINFFQYLIAPQNLKLCTAIVITNAVVYFSSFDVLLSYGALIVRPLKINSTVFMNFFGIQICIFILISLITVKILGRRVLMFYGFLALTLIQFCIGLLLALEEGNNYKLLYIPQIFFSLISLFLFSYMLSVYPTIHVLRTEIFPSKLKDRATCILVIFKKISEFVVTSSFFPLSTIIGMSSNFFIYSVVSAVGAYFVYKFLKETRDKTLAEIKNDYKT